jgi:hypothetical protein
MELVNRLLLIVTLACAAVAASSGFSVAGAQFSARQAAVAADSEEGPFHRDPEYTMAEHLQ